MLVRNEIKTGRWYTHKGAPNSSRYLRHCKILSYNHRSVYVEYEFEDNFFDWDSDRNEKIPKRQNYTMKWFEQFMVPKANACKETYIQPETQSPTSTSKEVLLKMKLTYVLTILSDLQSKTIEITKEQATLLGGVGPRNTFEIYPE